ncbi:MAG: hypothetical protein A2571_02715 [Candidatus Vogelbacteria bacterium RIFOXYD1_FULL_44_32]|uniref:Magnesium transport protein CorA n=1 Tax=Candidatus Vogelbacteria bacterium RIFOXYD1_FULL_44_32 TaxID=1802438 RepID=A0A1G2QDQ4_9BACT|nr:MAG: hypothetical protein A2571_02715 [Candidatus Vogelbacteria bacterium RIFOXYD1_FULL_44_32]
MIRQFKHRETTWIDVTSPAKEELATLARDYGLHSLVENELGSPSTRAHADLYDNYIYLVLHFPHCDFSLGPNKDEGDQEVDFIVGKDFLITIHYEPIQSLDEFGQIFEANLVNEDTSKKNQAGILFYHIALSIYKSLDAGLLTISDELRKAEKEIFNGKEKEMVVVLSNINHKLFDYSWALKNHADILLSFDAASATLFGNDYSRYTKKIYHTYRRIYSTLESLKEMFDDLQTTNDSLLSIKTNEIMKVLTIMAFTTFPLTVLTSMFGMNTIHNPILGMRYDFWVIVAMMLGAVGAMFIFFRYKRWF